MKERVEKKGSKKEVMLQNCEHIGIRVIANSSPTNKKSDSKRDEDKANSSVTNPWIKKKLERKR